MLNFECGLDATGVHCYTLQFPLVPDFGRVMDFGP